MKNKRPSEKAPKPRGRPGKYEEKANEYNLKAWLLAVEGKRNKELAAGLGISASTLFEWQQKHEDFSSAVKRGRAVACGKLEETLYSLAQGREIEETKIIGQPVKDEKGNIVMENDPITGQRKPKIRPSRVEKVKKVVLPDREAILACLRAWKPKDWNLPQRHALGGDPEAPPLAERTVIILPDNQRGTKPVPPGNPT